MSVNLGTAYAELKLKTDSFSSGIKSAQSELDTFQNKANLVADGFNAAGASMTKTGSTLTKTVTMPILGIGTAAVKVGAEFDQSMSKVQALSGAVGDNFTALRDKAIEMGDKTAFSATEAADAFGYMALAGWNTQQMIDGIPGVLDLAAASQMDLAEASDLVTDYLSAFALEASDSTRMANELAYAQANSNTTTQQLGEAYKNSAAQMHTAGQTLETTTAILGRWADQGLKSSEAGTALSATIRDITQKMSSYSDAADIMAATEDGLVSVTGDMNDILGKNAIQIGNVLVPVSDAQGNFRDLLDIMKDVETATNGMGSAEKSAALMTTFTARSIKGVSMTLTEGADNIKKFREELDATGDSAYAAETAATMLANLNGYITILKSNLTTLAIQISDILTPYVGKAVQKFRELVQTFTAMSKEQKEQILKWAGIVAAIGPVLLILGKLLTSIGGIVKTGTQLLSWSAKIAKAFGLISSGAGGITAGLGAVASVLGPILAVVAAVVALGAAFKALYAQNGAFKASVDSLSESLKNGLENTLNSLKTAINFLAEGFKPVIETFKNSFDLSAVDEAMGKLVNTLGKVITAVKPIAKFIGEVLVGLLAAKVVPTLLLIIGAVNGVLKAINPLIDTITSILDVVTDIADIITGLVEGIITGDFTKLKEAFNSLVADIGSVVTNLFATIWALISGFFEGIFVTIDSFTGGMLTKIGNFFVNLWNSIVTFFTVTIPEAFNNFVNVIIPQFIDNVKTWFDQLPYNIGYALGYAFAQLEIWGSQLVEWASIAIPEFIDKVIKFFSELPSKIWTWLVQTVEKVVAWKNDMENNAKVVATNFVQNIIEKVKKLPGQFMEWIKELPNKVLSIATSLYNAGVNIMNSLWDGLKSVWESISGWFEGIVDKVGEFISGIVDGIAGAKEAAAGAEGSHADGLAYVPYNGYRAVLHEGERVLTRNESEEYNAGKGRNFVINFYSPKELDPYEANKQFVSTMRKMEEGFLL